MHRHRYEQVVLFFWIIITIIQAIGCATGDHKREKVAIELLEEGEAFYQAGKYRLAIESFENLIDWYPFSVHASQSELRIGDAYYKLGEYHDAIFAYEGFERLHPTHEKAPYVLNQIGMCFLNQLDTLDRDQSSAIQAVRYFDRIRHEYPQSSYATQAKNKMMTCYKSLAENEFYVGMIYYKAERYQAAMNRFQIILKRYPDVGLHKKAIAFIAKCRIAMAQRGQSSMIRR